MFITVNQDTLSLTSGSEIILHHQTWEDYENLLNIRQENTLPKIYFNAKTQEIRLMSPLPSHGNRLDILRDLVLVCSFLILMSRRFYQNILN